MFESFIKRFRKNNSCRSNPSDRTIELIREHLSDIGIILPITEEMVEDVHMWFVNTEIELADRKDAGEDIDRQYLMDVEKAVDELQPEFDGIKLNIEYINRKLLEYLR